MIVGYDSEAIDALIEDHNGESGELSHTAGRSRTEVQTRVAPPGNSLDTDQRARVADMGDTLDQGLSALLSRIRAELDWNDARGSEPYRLGMHDGLRFAEDAVTALLAAHGHPTGQPSTRAVDA